MKGIRFGVILENYSMYYYYEGFKYIEAVSTSYNHYGIGCLDSGPNCEFFVCPSKDIGKICIKHFHHPRKDLIKAHKHDISAIAVHSESKLVATASEKVFPPFKFFRASFPFSGDDHFFDFSQDFHR